MAKGLFGNLLKGAWNVGKGILKKIPVVGGLVNGLEKLNFGKGATDLENSKGSVLGDALGAALPGLISGGVNLLTSHFSSKAEIRQRKELMDYQHNLSMQDYERELADKRQLIAEDRQYNSIGAQMARAEQAGVSPLAALGVSAGNSVGASSPTHQAVQAPAMGNNFLENIATLKQLDMMKAKNDAEVYRLKQAGDLDKQKAETETYNSIMRKLETENYPRETDARIREMLKRGDLAGAQKELAIAQTETEGHKQSNLDAQSALANAQALKTKFEHEYEEKYNRTMSNGLSNVIDTFSDFIFGNGSWRERVLDSMTNGRGLHGVLDDLFTQFMKLHPGAINEEVRKLLFDMMLKFFTK